MQTTNPNRQFPLAVLVDCGVADVGAGNENTVAIPPNALVTEITADIVVAFNSATTDTMTIGDGTTTFASAVSTHTVGRETVTGIGKFYPTGGTITIGQAQTGAAPTTGRVLVSVKYLVVGRASEPFGS